MHHKNTKHGNNPAADRTTAYCFLYNTAVRVVCSALSLRTSSSNINCVQTCRYHLPTLRTAAGLLPATPSNKYNFPPLSARQKTRTDRPLKKTKYTMGCPTASRSRPSDQHYKTALLVTPAPGDPVAGHPTPLSLARQRFSLWDPGLSRPPPRHYRRPPRYPNPTPASCAGSPPQYVTGAAYSCP